MAKKLKIFIFFEILREVYVQKPKIIAALEASRNSLQENFNFNHYFVSTTYQKISSLAVQKDEIWSFVC
jgi:hypothetical protein